MPLHIAMESQQGRAPACALSFDALQQLEPAFALLRQKTGVRLSEYDDTVLHPSHAQLLADAIDRIAAAPMAAEAAAFHAVLKQAAASGRLLYCEGE